MKRAMIKLNSLMALLGSFHARSQNLLDFGKFTHKVVGVKPLSGFTSETGEKVAPSRRIVSTCWERLNWASSKYKVQQSLKQ